jgi:hypothetical protein
VITDYHDQKMRVFVSGMFQRLLTNVAVVKRVPADVLVLRGIYVTSDPSLGWTSASSGDKLDLIIKNKDGFELTKKVELLTLTIGQNVQGRYTFWHARFAL